MTCGACAQKVSAKLLALFLAGMLVLGAFPAPVLYADMASTTIESRLQERGTDTTPPTIETHGNESAVATSVDGAIVFYLPPATTDNVDGPGTASCTPASGSVFPVGSTVVTCSATDAAGNSATPSTFTVVVSPMPEPESTNTATSTTAGSGTVGTTPDTATSTNQTATSTSGTQGGMGTSSDPNGGVGTVVTDGNDPGATLISTTNSAYVDPEESNTDNTDFDNIGTAPTPDPNDPREKVDVSATSTESAAEDPQFVFANDDDGTGSKTGGVVFTGNAKATTRIKNTLNVTRSNVDGPGVANSSNIISTVENEAELTTDSGTNAKSGENTALGGDSGSAIVRTGNAVATAEVMNVVNTNIFNSDGLVLFLNPFNGDGFDLRDFDLSYFLNEGPGASPTQYGCTILTCLNSSDLSVLNTNKADVNNTVNVHASTGENNATAVGDGDVEITTGDAYAAANVLNMVNTNFINSSYLVVAFNNFGDLNDDIVLPSASFFQTLLANGNSLPEMNSSSYVVNNTNDENFFGTTTASAITGGNLASTTCPVEEGCLGHGEILTGNAYTSSQSYTAANQTRVGGSSVLFTFRVWGEWSGTIQGLPQGMTWRASRADDGRSWFIEIMSTGGTPNGTTGIYNSSGFMASSTNVANVRTDVNVSAITGKNYTDTQHGVGRIATGDAYAAANVINLVNTNIIARNWIFGSFNIFGDWSGDISFGGSSPDLAVVASTTAPDPIVTHSDIEYAFTVTNNGSVPAENVVLTAAYNKGALQYVRGSIGSTQTSTGTSWNLGTLAPGASRTIVATLRVLVTGIQEGISVPLSVSANVVNSARDQDDSDNTAQAIVYAGSSPASEGETTRPPSGEGSTTPPPSGGGNTSSGGGGSTDPRNNEDRRDESGGAPVSNGGGSTTPPPSGGGNTPPPSSGGNTNPGGANTSNSGTANAGGFGLSSGGATGTSGVVGFSSPPQIRLSKTSNIASTTAPAVVDYSVVVKNDPWAGKLFNGVLTDTLYNPTGDIVHQRSWPLDTVIGGDEIYLTYSAEFSKNMKPGIYRNVVRVTGITGNPDSMAARQLDPVEASRSVEILPSGLVLGDATSTVSLKNENLKKTTVGCPALLSKPMGPGLRNDTNEVRKLQAFLAKDPSVYPGGIVSGIYGPLTVAAVKAFQKKYAADVLFPVGLVKGTGYAGSSTIRKINELNCGGVAPTASADTAAIPTTSAGYIAKPAPKKSAKKKEEPTTETVTGGFFSGLGNIVSKFRW